ncbi:MAG: response regulator transcription factor, partial [Bacteroidales bacterium]|nr:response regulator transcription factor [Bacteroidales bacterium]
GTGIDLILLDVMMTPKSGFEWAKELKKSPATANIPIIFCTAKNTENDLLTGFGLGSDDYIGKPFRISEVKARVTAVLRRTSKNDNNDNTTKNILRYKGIVMNLDSKECTIDGQITAFTKLEFEVLALLLSKPGQVFSREKILQTAWPDHTIVLDRTVDVNITRIRKKIGQYGEHLRTKFGYGYLFDK